MDFVLRLIATQVTAMPAATTAKVRSTTFDQLHWPKTRGDESAAADSVDRPRSPVGHNVCDPRATKVDATKLRNTAFERFDGVFGSMGRVRSIRAFGKCHEGGNMG
ncbi:hypothetical protein RB195_017355 [Necator americanus]|uniref:Uncharacterized protein n=1 Tax=Necator americanus TaxID=51031 RepID=A0ABR1C8H0_NECAM